MGRSVSNREGGAGCSADIFHVPAGPVHTQSLGVGGSLPHFTDIGGR